MSVFVKKPKAIVFDLLGTASKSGFLEHILFPYLKINMESYVTKHWDDHDFVKIYNKIQLSSAEFHKSEPSTPIVLAHEHNSARPSLMTFISFVTDNGINCPPVTQLRFMVWFEGYQHNKLHTPIYSDVSNQMRKWFSEGIKFYVFSNTWAAAQKALLKKTNHGDLTNLISGHYDNDFGLLTESDTWRRLCAEIREAPNETLFLTKSPIEARAAADAGLMVVLVLTHRHNVKAISSEDRKRFPYLRTFNDLAWIDAQAEQATPSVTTDATAASSVVNRQSESGLPKQTSSTTNQASRVSSTANQGSRASSKANQASSTTVTRRQSTSTKASSPNTIASNTSQSKQNSRSRSSAK